MAKQLPVALFGATGRVGGAVLRHLIEAGQPVRALTRHPEQWRARKSPLVEVMGADFARPATLPPALDGCARAFLLSADHPDQVAHETAMIEAAKTVGIEHIVKSSAQSAGLGPPVSFGRMHFKIEETLRGSNVPYTILRPTFFMQSFLLFADDIRAKATMIVPCKRGKVAFCDAEDVAAVAAKVLLSGAHQGETLTLSGPEALTFGQAASLIGEATGRAVRHVAPPRPIARLVMPFATDMPRWLVKEIVDLLAALDKGEQARIEPDIERVLGRKPARFAAYAARHKQDFMKAP